MGFEYKTWRKRDGSTIAIADMDIGHIRKVIVLLQNYEKYLIIPSRIFANSKFEDDVMGICEEKCAHTRNWINAFDAEVKKRNGNK